MRKKRGETMRSKIVFDRKKGVIGVKRLANKKEEKEFGTNYVVDILDPINFRQIETVAGVSNPDYDWHGLPRKDPRVQFWKLFNIIAGADWCYSGYSDGDGIQVDEATIENQHEVFESIRELFG